MNLIQEAADRLISNSWDTYIPKKVDERNWLEIADCILKDGRAVANAWLSEQKEKTNEQ